MLQTFTGNHEIEGAVFETESFRTQFPKHSLKTRQQPGNRNVPRFELHVDATPVLSNASMPSVVLFTESAQTPFSDGDSGSPALWAPVLANQPGQTSLANVP